MHAILGLVFFICLVYVALRIFAAVATAAFPGLGSARKAARGAGAKALRSPAPRAVGKAGRSAISAAAHPTNGQVRTKARADAKRAWTEVRATNWLEQQRHGRANGTAAIGGANGTATATRPAIWRRLRLRPFTPSAAAGASGNGGANGPDGTPGTSGQAPGTSGNGSGQGTCSCGRPLHSWGACSGCGWFPGTCVCPPVTTPPENGRQDPAPQAKTPPAPSASTNGGPNVAGTSTASADQLTEAINQIYAHAASGGLTAKQEAVRAMHEAAVKFAGMTQMLSRTMSEPGSNYGPEITEPLGKAGTQFQAGAMLLSEADNALETLANMTLREVAQSPRQAPDKTELAESGRH